MTQILEHPEQSTPDDAGPRREGEDQRVKLLQVVVVVLLGIGVAALLDAAEPVLVVIALLTMIMLHELGHFLTAKWGGMKVTEFFVGFGPRLWSVRKGETEYGIKAIPIGGYVKIIGMHNLDEIADPADEPRTYRQKPFPQRLAVAVAGSTMHFIIAFILFFVVNTFVGIPTETNLVGSLAPLDGGGSPAINAGMEVGDAIVAIDGTPIERFGQIRGAVEDRVGQDVVVTVERAGQRLDLTATPVAANEVRVEGKVVSTERRGFLGVGSAPLKLETTDPITAIGRSAKQFVDPNLSQDEFAPPSLTVNAKALASVVSPSGMADYFRTVTRGSEEVENELEGTRFLSPVGFVRVADQAAAQGFYEVLVLMIAINLFVGLFNLLPLLPLDGGHVAIALYELVRERFNKGRRYFTDVAKLLPITYVVVMVMVFLGVSALYLDIVRPLNIR